MRLDRRRTVLHLSPGSYRLLVQSVRTASQSGKVGRGALVEPVRSKISFHVERHGHLGLIASYGTILNPGVRPLPGTVVDVLGESADPRGLLLRGASPRVVQGDTLTSGPTPLLPFGLVARVTDVRRSGAEEEVSLSSVPVTSALPAIVTTTPIEMHAVQASAGLGVQVEQDLAGPCGLSAEADLTPIVGLKDVTFSSDIRLEPWDGGPKVDFTIKARQEAGLELNTSGGVQCSVTVADPTLVGVVYVGVPVPVYLSLPISLDAALSQQTKISASATWDATYGMRTHTDFLVPVPSPVFEVHNFSSKLSTTSGPQFTFEPNIAVEPGLGVPDVGNLHLDIGTGVQFALEPSHCEWDWRIGSFSATADLGPVKIGSPDFTAKTLKLWEGCHGAGATPPPPPPPPPPPAAPASEAGDVAFPGGPLSVFVGQRGECQSSYSGSGNNYFPPEEQIGDCGLFLAFPSTGVGQPAALDGTTWGFDGAAGPKGLDTYTPVSQSPITGAGTSSDPYTEVTTFQVDASEPGEEEALPQEAALVRETTTYVNGTTQFTSTYDVKNTSPGTLYFRAIYAGDLYTGGDDFGTGAFESGPPRFVGGENPISGAIDGFLEAGGLPWSTYQEGCWNDTESEAEERCDGASATDGGIWKAVESTVEDLEAFNGSVEPAFVDNAAGVEWDQLRSAGLPAGHEQAFAIINSFRP
jgi:hypothetical protein